MRRTALSSLGMGLTALAAAGLSKRTSFNKIGVVVARGSKTQIQNVRTRPSGAGVSVGVIDTGVDPTHPYLTEADGSSVVVSNQKVLCDPTESACQVLQVPNDVDTDTLSSGAELHGAAPGAKLVSVSTGAALVIVGADTALNWVLENHDAPCGAEVPAAECPPIKVTNNSYDPSGGGEFDPESATVKLQRALAAEGVLTVWANGNDGGDGSESLSNPPGMDPTGGVISVASYNDLETGTRDGEVSEFSSRGKDGDQRPTPTSPRRATPSPRPAGRTW